MIKSHRVLTVLILSVVFLLLSSSTLAVSANDYKPSWYQSWEGSRSILQNLENNLNPWDISEGADPTDDADYLGWYNGTFFGLANWEREVCLMDLSSTVRNSRNRASGTTEANLTYTTTLSLSAKKTFYYNSTYLYETSFYFQPFTDAGEYRVYLYNPTAPDDKLFLFSTTAAVWKQAARNRPQSGYDAKYLDKRYTKAVLEYREGGVEKMEVSIS